MVHVSLYRYIGNQATHRRCTMGENSCWMTAEDYAYAEMVDARDRQLERERDSEYAVMY